LSDDKTSRRVDAIETSVDKSFREVERPGFSDERDDTITERKDAAELSKTPFTFIWDFGAVRGGLGRGSTG
jgi:hypothetical protein